MARFVFSSFFLVVLVCSLGLLVVPAQPVSAGLGGGEPQEGDPKYWWPVYWRLWQGGAVPVLISKKFTTGEIGVIRQALDTWRDRTGNAVRFDPISEPPSGDGPYVNLMTRQEFILTEYGKEDPPLCGSWGPHYDLPTYTWLHQLDGTYDDANCVNVPSVIHEIGHAIGLGHEQLRPDRELYITFQNPFDPSDKAPVPWPEEIEPNPVGFFDYYSFMHTQTEHATPKAPDVLWPLPWAHLGGPSDGDIDTVRALYAFDIGYDQDIQGGDDYAHLILASGALHRDCMLACAADIRCQAYTYVGVVDGNPHCYLKDGNSFSFSGSTGMYSGVRKPDQKCSFGVAFNVDLVGDQISDRDVSMPHNLLNGNNCKDLCAQEPWCEAFTFVPGMYSGTCLKKTHNPDISKPPFEYQLRDGYMSGVIRRAGDPLNLAPTSDAGGLYTVEWMSVPGTSPQGAEGTVSLDGTGSSDPEGSSLAYFWTTDCLGAYFDDSRIPKSKMAVYALSTPPICSRQCNVSLIVTDDQCFRSSRSTSTVTIQDKTPPTLIGVPADQTVQCAADEPDAPRVTAEDNYHMTDVPSFTETRVNGNCADDYTLTRTWTAVDDCGNTKSATQIITVQDTEGPSINCHDDAFITPSQAPISFTATATDNCSDVTVQITGFDCVGKNGKSKLESCVVEFSGSTITIRDSGGVGDKITWTVQASDSCGNITNRTCDTSVVNLREYREIYE